MSETAQELVDRMVAAGEWPEPELLEAIAAAGEEAAGPLIEVVGRDLHGWPEEAPVYYALGLLGDLGSRSAIPVMLDVFRRYDNENLDSLPEWLGKFGAEVIEPTLEIARDRTLDWYPRAMAIETAKAAAGDDPALRARVAEDLRAILADCLTRAEEPVQDDYDMTSSVVGDLADLADPLALDLIHAAYEADLIDESMIGTEEEIQESYREGGRWASPEIESPSFLTLYHIQYREHLDAERRRREPPPPPIAHYRPTEPYIPPPVHEPIRRSEWRPGRNDPCWCGSGKKYKNCHLRHDGG